MAETGHAKNLEHFSQMIEYVKGYGALYNPTNPTIALSELQLALTDAQATIPAVTAALAPLKVVINDREAAFLPVGKLVTKVVNAFAVSGATENAIEDAVGLKKKSNGTRVKKLPKDDPATLEDESKGNSVSQRSYTQRIEHLDNLIKLLVSDGHYNPNENPIKITTLNTLLTTLKTKNQAVLNKIPAVANARVGRDTVLYGTGGICDRAALVKKYVKSVFGGDSAQFHQLGSLTFRRPKI